MPCAIIVVNPLSQVGTYSSSGPVSAREWARSQQKQSPMYKCWLKRQKRITNTVGLRR